MDIMMLAGVNVGFWAILPPIIAIILALITKEVISSLLVGIFSGALIYSIALGGSFSEVVMGSVETTFEAVGCLSVIGFIVGLMLLVSTCS